MVKLIILAAVVLSFAELRVDSVIVDSVWNSDSASRVSRDCRVLFIPQGEGHVYASLSVSSDGGETFWANNDSAFVIHEALRAIARCGEKKTVIIRVLGGDRDNFVVRIKVRQPNRDNWPAWRKAMTQPNTIYDISDNSTKYLDYTFPGGVLYRNGGVISGPDSCIADQFVYGALGTVGAYCGGVLLKGAGSYGVMTSGAGGHNSVGNTIGDLNLNGDMAHYEVWQQPTYSLTPGPGIECYWGPNDTAAMPANRKFPMYAFDHQIPPTWDGGFPVATGAWIYSYPVKYLEFFDGVPMGQFRYDQHCYIPAEYTGLGTGVWFIPANIFNGPGIIYGINSVLLDPSSLWDATLDTPAVWAASNQKYYSHYQREDNKAWAHTPYPIVRGHAPTFGGNARFCEKYRTLVVPATNSSNVELLDLSSGIERGVWSLKPTHVIGREMTYVQGKSDLSNGHPDNRAFYVLSGCRGLTILDLDDPTYPWYNHSTGTDSCVTFDGSGGISYIPALNKWVRFEVAIDLSTYCHEITIPNDLGDSASYVVENVPLTLAPGVVLEDCHQGSNGQTQYVEALDCIVFMSANQPAKAFWLQ